MLTMHEWKKHIIAETLKTEKRTKKGNAQKTPTTTNTITSNIVMCML